MSRTQHIRNQLNHQDPHFIDGLVPYFRYLERYFRYETVGLENIPANRSCLLVMNHGIIPFHGFLLFKQLVEKRQIYPRGLGAGFLFSIPIIRDFFLKGGAVNANPKNTIALLKKRNVVMLAPGGIYEGLISKPGMKRIPWERRKGFVRLAVEAGVPIVPTYCYGINEVYNNSSLFLKMRIKILESTRFSLPLFYGIGLLPLPRKLVHFVSKPIPVHKRKGESKEDVVLRVHHAVMDAMKKMAN